MAAPAMVQRTASFAVGLRAAQSTALEAVFSAGGVLTSLEVDVQSPVKDGSLFASVDNKPIFAMIAPVPPIGDLRLGDTGPAVAALQGWLTGLGFEAPTSSTFDRATAAAVALALYPGTEGAGRLVAPTAEEVLSVPASAVVTDATGATCVFPDATGAAVPVTPVGDGLGTIELAGDVELVNVLVNPAAVRTDLACG